MSISTVWSIEVGKSSLKAVKIHREQTSLEVVAVDKVDFQAGESGIDSIGQAKDALRVFASRNQIDCPVAVIHPSRAAFSRFIQLPPVDAKKLQEMIGYEAQQQIPFPIDEVIWDYHVSEGENGTMEKEVGIFAVRREAISDFILDYERFPLELISIGYIGLLNYVLFDLRPNRPVVVLDVGSDDTDLLIVDGKRFWFRSLTGAGKDFTLALQEKFKLDFPQAEELKTEGAKSEHAAKIFQVLQPHLRDLVNEINRSIGFYKSQAGEVKFEDLFLFGNGSKLLGLKNFLQEHLKFHVHVAKGFHRLRVNRESNVALLQKDFPAFASCVGAGIQALGEGECEVNLLPQEKQEALEFKKKQKIVIAATAALLIIPMWLHLSFGSKIRNAENARESTRIVEELDRTAREIETLENKTRPALEAAARDLISPVALRLEAHDAWQMVQTVYSEVKNAEVVPRSVIERPSLDVGKGQLEASQEELNDQKWWLTLVEIGRTHLKANGELTDKPDRNEVTTRVYVIEITGIRKKVGTEMENTNAVRERVHRYVDLKLRERYGANLPAEIVTVAISPEDPKSIFTPHPALRDIARAPKDAAVAPAETLFEYKVRWIQPIEPPRAAESN